MHERETAAFRAHGAPRFLVLAGLLVLQVGFTGCETSEPVEGRDDDVFFPSFRATWQLFPGKKKTLLDTLGPDASEAESDSEATPILPSFAIDLDFIYGSGDSSQRLAAGEVLEFGGTTFSGPARVGADHDFYVWTLAPRGGFWIYEIVAIDGYLGGGINYLDLELESGALRESDTTVAGGPVFGGQLTVNLPPPVDWLALYGKAGLLIGFGDGDTSLSNKEVGLTVSPVPGLGLIAGWRWWDYDEEGNGSDADVELKLSGPMAGIQVTF